MGQNSKVVCMCVLFFIFAFSYKIRETRKKNNNTCIQYIAYTHVIEWAVKYVNVSYAISDISIIFRFNSIWCARSVSLQNGNWAYVVCVILIRFFLILFFRSHSYLHLCVSLSLRPVCISRRLDKSHYMQEWSFRNGDKIKLPICIRFIIRGSMLNAH